MERHSISAYSIWSNLIKRCTFLSRRSHNRRRMARSDTSSSLELFYSTSIRFFLATGLKSKSETLTQQVGDHQLGTFSNVFKRTVCISVQLLCTCSNIARRPIGLVPYARLCLLFDGGSRARRFTGGSRLVCAGSLHKWNKMVFLRLKF